MVKHHQFFVGSLGKGGNSVIKISEDLIIFLQKIEQLKESKAGYETFKNIKGKWRKSLSTFFPFAAGAGKPNVVKSLNFHEALNKEKNEVVIGELRNGEEAYHLFI